MRHLRLAHTLTRGFSLVELITVIAVLGLMTAIMIPQLSNVDSSARRASSQRNAQHLVDIYVSGAAAGISWAGSTRNEKIAAVVNGAAPDVGAFAHKTFRVPNMVGTVLTDTYPFIGYDENGDLFYDMAGGQSSS